MPEVDSIALVVALVGSGGLGSVIAKLLDYRSGVKALDRKIDRKFGELQSRINLSLRLLAKSSATASEALKTSDPRLYREVMEGNRND